MRTVTASADGRAEGVPDLLTAQVGITTRGEAAGEVMAENGRLADALLARLRELGVDERDVTTTSVDLGQHHDRDGRPVGYQASNVLAVRFHGPDTAGEKLDALISVGGDAIRIHGVTLGFDDDSELTSAARADGVRRAMTQAQEMAAAAGVELGPIVSISDARASSPDSPIHGFSGETMVAKMASVPIAPGSREVVVRVTVVYEIT